MKKFLIAILMATVAGALTFGAAASLTVSADDLGAGTAPVESCDTDGINIAWNGNGLQVTETILTDVSDRCDGQYLAITLHDSVGNTVQVFDLVPVAPGSTDFTVDMTNTVGGVPMMATSDIVDVTLAMNGPSA